MTFFLIAALVLIAIWAQSASAYAKRATREAGDAKAMLHEILRELRSAAPR